MVLQLIATFQVSGYKPFNEYIYNSSMVVLYPFKQVQQAFWNNYFHFVNFFEKGCVLVLPPLLLFQRQRYLFEQESWEFICQRTLAWKFDSTLNQKINFDHQQVIHQVVDYLTRPKDKHNYCYHFTQSANLIKYFSFHKIQPLGYSYNKPHDPQDKEEVYLRPTMEQFHLPHLSLHYGLFEVVL